MAQLWNSCFNLKHLQNQHLGIDMKITLKPALKQSMKLCFCLGLALKLMLQSETSTKPASWHWHENCSETCSETIHKTMLLFWLSFETHASTWNLYETSILALTWKFLWNLLWNNPWNYAFVLAHLWNSCFKLKPFIRKKGISFYILSFLFYLSLALKGDWKADDKKKKLLSFSFCSFCSLW